MPQLWLEILPSGLEWSLRRKLEAAHLSVSQGVDTLKTVSLALSADRPLPNDPLCRVSEGRPSRFQSLPRLRGLLRNHLRKVPDEDIDHLLPR
jgi:hypothetical protein